METVMIDTDNPVLEFYSKLLYLLRQLGMFDKNLAQNLVEIEEENPTKIKLGVDLEVLEEWFQWCLDESEEEMQMMEDITVQCFADLSSQMRTEAARDLFQQWVAASGIPDDLFVHLRKKKELGDGVAAVTVVTSDLDRFERFCSNPEKVTYAGQVHLTS